jgi:Kef-type K+ transport system membrane component KefB
LILINASAGFKAAITTAIGPSFGLSVGDSCRTGFLLAGGGEFAFVVLTLAGKLGVLPDELVKILGK